LARGERRTDETQQTGVLDRPIRERLMQPLVVAARCNFYDTAEHLHAEPVAMGFDEFVGRADSARNLMLGIGHCSSGKSRMLALSTESWELQLASSRIPSQTFASLPGCLRLFRPVVGWKPAGPVWAELPTPSARL
jgi:hypothetical protein